MMKNIIASPRVRTASSGFTAIELMILVSTFAVLLTLGLPLFTNFAIRAKVTESLVHATAAKSSLTIVCQNDPTLNNITNRMAGYNFQEARYVSNIELGGDCDTPIISVATKATGAQPDPVLTLTGGSTGSTGNISWVCVSDGWDIHLPESCRS